MTWWHVKSLGLRTGGKRTTRGSLIASHLVAPPNSWNHSSGDPTFYTAISTGRRHRLGARCNVGGKKDPKFPLLHDIWANSDLSIVGRNDCGHMQVDEELRAPFEILLKDRVHILVSLPMLVRWQTSVRFNAEQILRQSGKFDFSESIFFDVQWSYAESYGLRKLLNLFVMRETTEMHSILCVNFQAELYREVSHSNILDNFLLFSTSRLLSQGWLLFGCS